MSPHARQRAIALDAAGDVPCTCAALRAHTRAMGEPDPAASVLGWHYDVCERTLAALREDAA